MEEKNKQKLQEGMQKLEVSLEEDVQGLKRYAELRGIKPRKNPPTIPEIKKTTRKITLDLSWELIKILATDNGKGAMVVLLSDVEEILFDVIGGIDDLEAS